MSFTANFLWMCQGYYRHSEGYTPEWQGMENFKGRIVHPQAWPDDLDTEGKRGRRDRLGRYRGDPDPRDRGRMRPRHDAAALADLFQDRPQRHRAGRDAAPAPGQGGVDPRDRAPQDPVRPGHLHPPILRAAGSGQEGIARRHPRGARPRLRHRDAFHAEIPAVAAAHRLRARRRSVPGHQERQGLRRYRRDRAVYRTRHSAEIRQDADSRHHHHRDRVQPQCARRHRFCDRRQAARFRATPSPIAA